ncbi:MAG: hypothetical protein IRZ21_08600 [Thermoleophilaceae bacterium]|nr:hypothetical protein [Thermoleophilaceae bacterium]
MSGVPGLVSAALARAEEWLLYPDEPIRRRSAVEPTPPRHPVVAVVGLGRRRGSIAVARGLAAVLAMRCRSRAAVLAELSSRQVGSLGAPGTLAAIRLARSLRPALGEPVRCCGRLCVVSVAHCGQLAAVSRPLAPLVVDVADAVSPRAAASLADAVVLVASPGAEPALAALSSRSLARVGPEPLVVLNGHDGAEPDPRWSPHADILLPRSPAAARIAAAGHEPAGALGAALRELAERIPWEDR